MTLPASDLQVATYVRRHLRWGWWLLLFYLTLGIVLEALHGFKVGWYLDVSCATRRLMWTLAHTHGTLLGLINIAYAVTLSIMPQSGYRRTFVSPCLLAAGLLLPGGFFLGGVVFYDGDPGMGVFLVPVGAMFLLLAVLLIAVETSKHRNVPTSKRPNPGAPGSKH